MKKLTLIALLLIGCLNTAHVLHPINMTVTDISHVDKKIHMKVKFFSDDLHGTLVPFCKTNIDIQNKTIDAATEKCLDTYIAARFKMHINNAPLQLKYKRTYLKEDVTYVEYECAYNKKIKSVKILNSLLFESFPEQKNVVHLNLNNTSQVLEYSNEKGESLKDISY